MKKLGLHAIVLTCIAVLLILGNWQLNRLEWKNNLISKFNENANKDPVSYPANISVNDDEFKNIKIIGNFIHDKEILLYSPSRTNSSPGIYQILVPFLTNNGDYILVNRGVVDDRYIDQSKRPEVLQKDAVELAGVIRKTEKYNNWMFGNTNKDNIWINIDIEKIAEYWGLDLVDFYVAALPSTNDNKIYGLSMQMKVRNDHLKYSITWFSLAGVLFIIYMVAFFFRSKNLYTLI
jgi:surfeit locus 1 family protein